MLQGMQMNEQIMVTESARSELEHLLKDAGGQKPRIYVAGFG